jgi:glycogen(starch) synthase
MLVSNPCNPDYRVIKQAQSLANAGYEVRVFCVWKPGLDAPVFERVNGVTYVRREWNPRKALQRHYFGEQKYTGTLTTHRLKRAGSTRETKAACPLPAIAVRWLQAPASKVLFNCFSLKRYKSFAIVFVPLLKDWRPDIIHAHDGVTLPAAVKAAKQIGARLIFDSHELETHRNPPLSWFQRKQVEKMEQSHLKLADQVITVGHCIADYLADKYSIKRPEVLYNAPEAPTHQETPRREVCDRNDVRSELKLSLRTFLFVYTGRVTLNRGLELAINALSKLQGFQDPKKHFDTDYHLVVVGDVQKGHDVILQRFANNLGVTKQVSFLPPVAPQRVATYIATANAAIIPIMPITLSYKFAMPNKLFEAMLAGLPIIGADLAEMGTFIEKNGLGLTYHAHSPDQCVEKMVELIVHFAQFQRGDRRQHELATRYSWHAQEEILLRVYRDILSGVNTFGSPHATNLAHHP